MKKVKWENITSILIAMYFTYANTTAFIKDGFNFTVFMFELVLDVALIYAWHYITKNIRISW